MNKKIIILIVLILVIGLGAGIYFALNNSSNNGGITDENIVSTNENTNIQNQAGKENVAENENTTNNEKKVLIAYFSIPETDDPNNMTREEENSAIVVNGQVLGNTQYVAMLLESKLGGDLYRIETAVDYPLDHDTLVDQAQEEKSQNARPELKNPITNMDEYDTIFLGYPNWWGDLPMPLYTFLEQYDFDGKTVIPFNTHGGSGLSSTVSTITNKLPNATVQANAFTLSRNNMEEADQRVTTWLNTIGYEN